MADSPINDDKLQAIAGEISELETSRQTLLSEIGEKILPELAGRPEFAELTAKLNGIAKHIDELKRQEAELLEEKARREKEEKERLMKRTCFRCKAVNPEGSKFCEECGAKLGEPPREYCKICGTMNPDGMKFCGECGAKLGA